MRLSIWDTSGQERYKSLSPLYYRDADAAILMYDMTNIESLKDICNSWIQSVEDYGPVNIIVTLVGTKLEKWKEIK